MKSFKAIALAAALLTSYCLKAQDQEFGIFLGVSQYQGDLAKNMVWKETKPSFGVLGRYYLGAQFALRGSLTFGTIEGSDGNYKDDPKSQDRAIRNLSFRSRIYDFSGLLEYNIRPFVSNSKKYRLSPYIFTGLAVYHFNPQTEYQGKWVDLQPLGTEGQMLKGGAGAYSLTQISIPTGIGIKYSLGNFWNIGFEATARKTFTDYLDDVSNTYPNYDDLALTSTQAANLSDRSRELGRMNNKGGGMRGNPKNNDMYFFTGITITRTFCHYSCARF